MLQVADLVLRNGKVITVDAAFTIAEGVAVAGDRIIAVGSDAEITPHILAGTKVVNLKGRTVVPGMIHVRTNDGPECLEFCLPRLGYVRSMLHLQETIAHYISRSKPGECIMTLPLAGPPAYLDAPPLVTRGPWPRRQDLDEVAPDNPVLIRLYRGPKRIWCANTAALKSAGITRDTVSPDPSLQIERDENRDPTGVLIESCKQQLVEMTWFREVARLSRARALQAYDQRRQACATTGIFEVYDASNGLLGACQDLLRDGSLTMRATLALNSCGAVPAEAPLGPFLEALSGKPGERSSGDDWLKVTGVYVEIEDRVPRMAAMSRTGWVGFTPGFPAGRLKELALHCAHNDLRLIANAGFSPGIIEILEQVDKQVPLNGRRWVLGFAGQLSPRDIEGIAHMGLIIVADTHSGIEAGKRLKASLPPERWDEIMPLRRLLDANVKVAMVTHFNMSSIFLPIWESFGRLSGEDELVAPNQAITREEAIRCATYNGAYLSFDEAKKGSIEPGKFADLAVLSADPLSVADQDIRRITSLMTIVGGRTVYQSPNGNAE